MIDVTRGISVFRPAPASFANLFWLGSTRFCTGSQSFEMTASKNRGRYWQTGFAPVPVEPVHDRTSERNKKMITRSEVRSGIPIVLAALGAGLYATYLLLSIVAAPWTDFADTQATRLRGVDDVGNIDLSDIPQPIPPALQKGFLR